MGIDRVAKRGRENVAVFASDPAGREPGRDDADVTDAPETSEEREDRLALRVRPLSEARADTGREGRLRVDSVERGEGTVRDGVEREVAEDRRLGGTEARGRFEGLLVAIILRGAIEGGQNRRVPPSAAVTPTSSRTRRRA
ncbi:hypothetical protein ACFQL0_22595 [Haloplanus litoreus]|uniref:Uncharacterized protein n=1 Tax=Haloplanus litoreus TaxID=767515 RepID=A0ABD6A4J8_9EURY